MMKYSSDSRVVNVLVIHFLKQKVALLVIDVHGTEATMIKLHIFKGGVFFGVNQCKGARLISACRASSTIWPISTFGQMSGTSKAWGGY